MIQNQGEWMCFQTFKLELDALNLPRGELFIPTSSWSLNITWGVFGAFGSNRTTHILLDIRFSFCAELLRTGERTFWRDFCSSCNWFFLIKGVPGFWCTEEFSSFLIECVSGSTIQKKSQTLKNKQLELVIYGLNIEKKSCST